MRFPPCAIGGKVLVGLTIFLGTVVSQLEKLELDESGGWTMCLFSFFQGALHWEKPSPTKKDVNHIYIYII